MYSGVLWVPSDVFAPVGQLPRRALEPLRPLPGLTMPDGPTAARNVETHAVRTVDYPTSDTTSESLYIESRRP